MYRYLVYHTKKQYNKNAPHAAAKQLLLRLQKDQIMYIKGLCCGQHKQVIRKQHPEKPQNYDSKVKQTLNNKKLDRINQRPETHILHCFSACAKHLKAIGR